jgi:hypothetical protein
VQDLQQTVNNKMHVDIPAATTSRWLTTDTAGTPGYNAQQTMNGAYETATTNQITLP